MITRLKNVFNLTNRYIILATPLIIYSLVSNLYAMFSASGKLINLLFALVLLSLMSGAFLAGWFVMVKKAVADEYPNNPNLLIKDFMQGVGEYFLPTMGGIICMTVFSTILLALAFILGNHFIGDIGVTSTQLLNAMTSSENLKTFLTSLSVEQIAKINQWNLLILFTMFLNSFLLIFYFPAIFYKNKNPLIALFINLKNIFSKKFFIILGATVIIAFLYLFISVLSALMLQNIFLHFLITLLGFYLTIALVIWIFDFYNRNFVLSHLGQNIDETV